MKRIVTIFSLMVSVLTFSQEFKTIYYDQDWKEIESKSKASFYREIKTDPTQANHFIVTDYYITGEMQMKAVMSSLKPEVFDGLATYYYKNGNKDYEQIYVKGEETGSYKKWYSNGTLKAEGDGLKGKKVNIWKSYYPNGKLRTEGSYTNGEMNGEWKIYNLEGVYYLKYKYNNGIIVDVELIDKSLGYYEYFMEIESDKLNLTPFIGFKSADEYKLTENLIRNNITLIKSSTNTNVLNIVLPFTQIWLTNCPYLGKFAVYASKFMQDYTTENSFEYSSAMTKMYFLGLGQYFLDNKGVIKDQVAYQESGANFMVDYYLLLKKSDSKISNKKMDELVKLKNEGKLYNFIAKY